MIPISVGKALSPIPHPRQIAVKGLTLDEPERFSFDCHLYNAVNYIDEFPLKTSISAPLIDELGVNIYAQELFSDLLPVKIQDNLFITLLPVSIQGRQYLLIELHQSKSFDVSKTTFHKQETPVDQFPINGHEVKEHKISPRPINIFDLLLPLLQPPLRLGSKKSVLLPYPLYKYQWLGVDKLIKNPSFLLADEMGTGKTVMACVAMKVLFQQAKIKNVLIVCPVSVVRVWIDHLRDWTPELYVTTIRGTPEERQINWSSKYHVYVVSYDTLRSDVLPKNNPGNLIPNFNLIIADEAQAIKNEKSGRNRAIRKVSSLYRWALTGTPIENKVDEVITIYNFLIPKYFPHDASKEYSELQIKSKIAPYMLRRLKKDVLKDLPPKIRQLIWLELDDQQQAAYREALGIERERLKGYGLQVSRIHIFSAIQKLKQICNFAPGRYESPKVGALLDIIEAVESSDTKLVMFSQYIEEGIHKINKVVGKRQDICVLTGEISGQKREDVIAEFKNNPGKRILLASLKTGGVGLTLTEASYVVHFDHWWNPAVMRQAEDRVHRKGQKASKINIYEFWMAGTIEERIYQLLQEKGLLAERFIDSLSSPEELEGKLSVGDLLGLFDLNIEKDGSIVEKPKGLFESKSSTPSPRMEVSVGEIKEKVYSLSPIDFEKLVRDVVQKMGYPNVEHVGQSSDGGIDVIAWCNTGEGIDRAYIQCKRYHKNVGVREIRDLYGVINARGINDTGILVTSSDFTSQSKSFAAQTKGRIRLMNGLELARYIQLYGIEI